MDVQVKFNGWKWTPSIGLFYGEGPNNEREQIAQPVMTSPWVVICSEQNDPEAKFVRIFPGYRPAARFVSQRTELDGG